MRNTSYIYIQAKHIRYFFNYSLMKTINDKIFNILVLDDHPIVSSGICALCSQIGGVNCQELNPSKESQEVPKRKNIDLYIIDIRYNDFDGCALIQELRSINPQCEIIVYTLNNQSNTLAKLKDLHINNIIFKETESVELISLVEKIYESKKENINPSIANNEPLLSKKENSLLAPQLSKREKEVLHYLSLGLSTADIAEKIYLSINTIQTYRKRLMKKFNAKNVAELIFKGKDYC